MKFALLSYSHHGLSIAKHVRELGHTVVGVMDPAAPERAQLVAEFGCPGFAVAGECLDSAAPEAAIVCGAHVAIPGYIQECVDRAIPFLLDKPFADCAARLAPVAAAVQQTGLAHALTLPNDASLVYQTVAKMRAEGSFGEPILYSERLNNGSPMRYDTTASAWLNDPAASGGGSWVVEGAHGIASFLLFVGDVPVEVVGAVISNAMYRREVEESSVGVLRTPGGVTGIIESGYTYPKNPSRGGDHHYRYVGSKASVFGTYGPDGTPLVEVHTAAGVQVSEDIAHSERMLRIVRSGIEQLQAGPAATPPIARALRTLEINDAVYAHARATPFANGPHPLGA
jgi:predicted dehydrogenase